MGRFSEDIIRLFELFKEETGKYKDLDLGKIKFRNIKLDKLFEARGGSSKYTKKYIREHTGKYPLLTGKLDNESIEGYIDTYDFEGECITYNKDNAGGSKIFYRPKGFKFSMNSHHVALFKRDTLTQEIKEIDDINYKYCMYALNKLFEIKKFGWKESANWNRIKGEEISIPEPLGNYTSYDIQKAIADFIEFVTLKSEEIQKLMDEIISKTELLRKNLLIKLFTKLSHKKKNDKKYLKDIIRLFELFKEETGKYKDLDLGKVEFEEKKLEEVAEFPRITRLQGGIDLTVEEYEKLNEEEKKDYYPLLTGTVENNQIGGFVHQRRVTERHLSKSNVISWSRINASFFFIQKEKFCISDDAFIMDVRRDYNINYIQIATMATMQNKEFGWTNKAGKEKIKQVKIPIPKSIDGNYTSYDIQKAIANFVEFITERHINTLKEIQELSDKLEKYLLKKFFKAVSEASNDGKSK